MKNYYYIQIIEDADGYFQENSVDFDDYESFRFESYHSVIDKHFKPVNNIVRLLTGIFRTTVFTPIEDGININFCLVDKHNYPIEGRKINLTQEQIESIRNELSHKISRSEGVYPENTINIQSQFVTPSCKFDNFKDAVDYNFKYFNKDTLVFGPPGSGKTTMLRMITIEILRDFLEQEGELDKLPVYVQLRKFNMLDVSFDNFLDNSIANSFHKFNFLSNDEYFTSGKLVLILDGADEIDFEKFKNFSSSISGYKKKHPYISFIISSRPDRSFSKLKTFRTCWIEPFNEKQIKEFTYKKVKGSQKWEEFISILNSSPEVYTLLQNPLMLTFSHFLFQSKSIIPLNTGQLLKELVNVLISSWDSQRKIERKLKTRVVNPNEIINVLGKLSLVLAEEKIDQIEVIRAHKYFKTFDTVELFMDFLQYIEFSTGIISVMNGGVYFIHKSLQDFFCSNYLVEGVQEINKKIFVDKDWGKILKMISGLSSDSNYLIKEIISNKDLDNYEKANLTLLLFSESNNLSKDDLKNSFSLLEKYFLKFEKENQLTDKNITSNLKQVFINSVENTKGFKELVELLKSILKLRFTKYEYDFNGYLNNSTSTMLRCLPKINVSSGDISLNVTDKGIIISNELVKKSNY